MQLCMSERTCSLHILCVSASRYTWNIWQRRVGYFYSQMILTLIGLILEIVNLLDFVVFCLPIIWANMLLFPFMTMAIVLIILFAEMILFLMY